MTTLPIHPIPSQPPTIREAEGVDPQSQQKLWQASQSLEAEFARFFLQEIAKTMPGMGDSFGGSVYADMFEETLAAKLAENNTLGISGMVYQQTADLAARTLPSTPPNPTPSQP